MNRFTYKAIDTKTNLEYIAVVDSTNKPQTDTELNALIHRLVTIINNEVTEANPTLDSPYPTLSPRNHSGLLTIQ